MSKLKVNTTGYLKDSKTKDNDINIIPSGNITTKGLAFSIFANGKLLHPDTGDYKFNEPYVVETPAFNKGGTMKKHKLKKKEVKMQAGGTASLGLNNSTLGAVGEGISLLSPHQDYQGTDKPNFNASDVLAGTKAGMAFGPVGAAVGGGLGLTKDIIDYKKSIQDFKQNVVDTRNENKRMYDMTHQPYGQRGYMQANPNKTVYSLFKGGAIGLQDGGLMTPMEPIILDKPGDKTKSNTRGIMPNQQYYSHNDTLAARRYGDEKFKFDTRVPLSKEEYKELKKTPERIKLLMGNIERGYENGGNVPNDFQKNMDSVLANVQTSHSDVSLTKQDGGKVPDDLNELFDRAMEESGGDEDKAYQLVEKYQNHPEMVQNKKSKHSLKKKK